MTGPMLFHSGTLSTWAPEMRRFAQHAYVEVAEADAEALGIQDGDPVRLVGDQAEVVLHAHVQPEGTPGILFVPLHYAEPAVNRLLDVATAVDRVRLERVSHAEGGSAGASPSDSATEGEAPAEPDARSEVGG